MLAQLYFQSISVKKNQKYQPHNLKIHFGLGHIKELSFTFKFILVDSFYSQMEMMIEVFNKSKSKLKKSKSEL